MTSSDRNDSRPFSRNRSQTITVAGEFAGDRVIYEVQTEEWRRKTGRYGRVWSARRRGSLAWNTGTTARKALFGAACLRGGSRPSWLTTAASEAEAKLR